MTQILTDASIGLPNGPAPVTNPTFITGIITPQVQYQTTGVTPTGAVGDTYWDSTNLTLATVLDATNGVVLQHGQEIHLYCKNTSGVTIANGCAVYISGAQGNHPTIAKAKADNISTCQVVGVTTQDFAINAFGYVTMIGDVHDIDTSGYTGDGHTLYVSAVTAGLITDVAPSSPNYLVTIGTNLNTTNNGAISVVVSRPIALDTTMAADSGVVAPSQSAVKAYINLVSPPQPLPSVTKEITGFSDPEAVTVSYDSTARTITLTGTFTAYYQGALVTALTNGYVSSAHAATTGAWFLYYNGSSVVWSQTPWTYDMLMIAYVYYGASNKFALRECHGFMSYLTHQELHSTIGTYLESGADIAGVVLASTTAADRRPSVATAYVHDEDIRSTITALADDGPYTILNLAGTGTSTFTLSAAEIVPVLTNNPYYNSFTTPNWGQTLMANASYMTVWLVAVPSSADAGSLPYRFLWLQGQTNGTLASQQAYQFSSMNLGQLATVFTEFVAVGKIIIRYQGGNWDITSVEKITGTRLSNVTAPAGSYLSAVTTSLPLSGTGTAADPVIISGAAVTAVASATLTAGQWVNFHDVAGVKNVRPADSTDATKPVHGYVLAGFASTATATVYLLGVNTLIPLGGFVAADIGKPVFLSTSGGTTLTPPSTTGNLLQQVGWVVAVGTTVSVNLINSPGIVRA